MHASHMHTNILQYQCPAHCNSAESIPD